MRCLLIKGQEDEGHGYSCGTVVPRGGKRIINFLEYSREGNNLEMVRVGDPILLFRVMS